MNILVFRIYDFIDSNEFKFVQRVITWQFRFAKLLIKHNQKQSNESLCIFAQHYTFTELPSNKNRCAKAYSNDA